MTNEKTSEKANEKNGTAAGRTYYPLANDLDGDPIELPANAFAWRVRRRTGKQGRPQCVYHPETGQQLHVGIAATVEDLREFGPGVYRLDAVDKDGNVIPNTIAQTEVTTILEDTDEAYGSRSEAAALIRHLVEANVRVMEAMASAFGQVRPTAAVTVPAGGGPSGLEGMLGEGSPILGQVSQIVQVVADLVSKQKDKG